jgi:hypothetical protein
LEYKRYENLHRSPTQKSTFMTLQNVGPYSTNGPGAAEYSTERANKEIKRVKKKKEGTDGIDATDERSPQDRFDDYRDLMRDDD